MAIRSTPPARAFVFMTTAVALTAAGASAAAYDVSTPEKAMALCNKAFFDGDAAALKAAAYFAPGTDDLFKAFVARGVSVGATQKLVLQKFGTKSLTYFPRLTYRPLSLPTKMFVTGNAARLLVLSDGKPDEKIPVAEFQKTGDRWQQTVVEKNVDRAKLNDRLLDLRVQTLVIDGFRKELADDKFKAVEDADAALAGRIKTLNNIDHGEDGEASSVGLWFKFGLGVEANPAAAFGVFLRGAKGGDAQAMAEAGDCYADGDGTRKDPNNAFKWFKQAADLKNTKGMRRLAVCYQRGTGTAKDYAKAVALLLGAVKTDDEALNYLGDTYRDGLGVKADDKTAAKYFADAAEKLKSGYAMLELARCYDRLKQPKKASTWYLRAGLAGDPEGMLETAKRMESGYAVERRSPELARTWYEKAAKAGKTEAAGWLKAHPAGR